MAINMIFEVEPNRTNVLVNAATSLKFIATPVSKIVKRLIIKACMPKHDVMKLHISLALLLRTNPH